MASYLEYSFRQTGMCLCNGATHTLEGLLALKQGLKPEADLAFVCVCVGGGKWLCLCQYGIWQDMKQLSTEYSQLIKEDKGTTKTAVTRKTST